MPLFSQSLMALAKSSIDAARAKKMRIVTAESCTGGLISACLTEVPGSSDAFDRGFTVYSNDAKMTNIGVSYKTLQDFGSVSAETALEMSIGSLSASNADIAVAVTGIAGPGGGTAEKPVGLVYLSISVRANNKSYVLKNNFAGDRTDVRLKTVEAALTALKKELESI